MEFFIHCPVSRNFHVLCHHFLIRERVPYAIHQIRFKNHRYRTLDSLTDSLHKSGSPRILLAAEIFFDHPIFEMLFHRPRILSPYVNMLKITDAERSCVVEIPSQLVECIGVFNDMFKTAQGSEPVLLLRLQTLTSRRFWMRGLHCSTYSLRGCFTFRNSTLQRVGPHPSNSEQTNNMKKMSKIYWSWRKSTIFQHLQMTFPYEPFEISQFSLCHCQVLCPTPLIPAERAYFLGAAYGAPILEELYRPYVVSHFPTLLTGPAADPIAESHFNLLNRRYPEKVFGLVKDAGKCNPSHDELDLTVYQVLAAENRVSQRESALRECKAVSSPI